MDEDEHEMPEHCTYGGALLLGQEIKQRRHHVPHGVLTRRYMGRVADEDLRIPVACVVEQIRKISTLDALAILDAVAIFTDHYENNGRDGWEAMEASGLSTQYVPPSLPI